MACGCGRKAQQRKANVTLPTTAPAPIPQQAVAPVMGMAAPTDNNTMVLERRRIESLRRQAIRKSLGLA